MVRSRLLALKPLFGRFRPPTADFPTGGEPARERRLSERRGKVVDRQHREFRLHAATQAAGIGTYDFDCVSGQLYWSPELKAIAGLADPEIGGFLDTWARVLHPADRDRVLAKLATALLPDGPEHLEDEHRLLRPDGLQRWVRIRGQTFFSDEGGQRRAWGASGVVQDITAAKDAEERLQESDGRCRALTEDARRRDAAFENLAAGLLRSAIAEDEGGDPGAPGLRVEFHLHAEGWFLVATGDERGNALAACRRIAGRLGACLRSDPEKGRIIVYSSPALARSMENP